MKILRDPLNVYTPMPENSEVTADRLSDPEVEGSSWDGEGHVPDSEDDFMTALTKKAWWNLKGKSWSKISGN